MDESFYSSKKNRIYKGGIADFVTKRNGANSEPSDRIEAPAFGYHISFEEIQQWYTASLRTLLEYDDLQELCLQFEALQSHIGKVKQEFDFLHLDKLLDLNLFYDSFQYSLSTDGIKEIAHGTSSDDVLLMLFQNALNEEYSFVKRFRSS